jgi:hypothetical protein
VAVIAIASAIVVALVANAIASERVARIVLAALGLVALAPSPPRRLIRRYRVAAYAVLAVAVPAYGALLVDVLK